MTNNRLRLILLLGLIGVITVTFACRQYTVWRWRQNIVDLNGTVQTGIQIQRVADDFKGQIGRYPTHVELMHLLPYICSFKEGVSPYQTNTISPVFDNSGGWFYDEKNGEVRVNYNGKYAIGFRSWLNVSQMNFHLPAKVDVIHYGKPETVDYSSLNDWLNSQQPDIQEVITNWSATNIMTTGLKNVPEPNKAPQNMAETVR